MADFGRTLVLLGIVLVVVGGGLWLAGAAGDADPTTPTSAKTAAAIARPARRR